MYSPLFFLKTCEDHYLCFLSGRIITVALPGWSTRSFCWSYDPNCRPSHCIKFPKPDVATAGNYTLIYSCFFSRGHDRYVWGLFVKFIFDLMELAEIQQIPSSLDTVGARQIESWDCKLKQTSWGAAPKGSMTYTFTVSHMGIFSSSTSSFSFSFSSNKRLGRY